MNSTDCRDSMLTDIFMQILFQHTIKYKTSISLMSVHILRAYNSTLIKIEIIMTTSRRLGIREATDSRCYQANTGICFLVCRSYKIYKVFTTTHKVTGKESGEARN